MARTRISEPLLKSWEEVDMVLKEIAENELAIEEIETSMNKQLHDIKLEAELKAEPHQENIKRLGLCVKEFVDNNKAELDGKTKQLNFGKTGFRLSTKVVIKSVSKVIESLINFKMVDCIVTKESINKDVLKKYPEDDIIKVGASLKKEDTFWYETERDKLRPSTN